MPCSMYYLLFYNIHLNLSVLLMSLNVVYYDK